MVVRSKWPDICEMCAGAIAGRPVPGPWCSLVTVNLTFQSWMGTIYLGNLKMRTKQQNTGRLKKKNLLWHFDGRDNHPNDDDDGDNPTHQDAFRFSSIGFGDPNRIGGWYRRWYIIQSVEGPFQQDVRQQRRARFSFCDLESKSR